MAIKIPYDGREYILDFNRNTVRQMEKNGFVVNTDAPLSMVTDLFRGAFMMHHRQVKPDKIEEIWDAQKGKDKLLAKLVSMYTKPLEDLMGEKEEEDENPTWEEV